MKAKFKESFSHFDPLWVEHGYGNRFQGFQNLMRVRIKNVLLVSSLYDLFVFEEDGRLYELIRNEYQGLNLSHAPEINRVSSGKEAIRLAKEEGQIDLIITTLHIEDMRVTHLAKMLREEGINVPIVLLAYDNRELTELILHHEMSFFDRVFIWQGDFRLIIAIIKHLEDKLNVEHDTQIVGVQSIILIEDNIRYYSSFLPLIYMEIMKQSQRLISEGINLSHKFLRMRARPKILLCTNYEEAWDYYQKYAEHILGIISDIDFPHNGQPDPQAGLEFAKNVKKHHPDIPILLQSNVPENEEKARSVGASFLLKDSPTLLHDLREFMNKNFSFGDFVFRTPDGREVGRAHDLISLEEQLRSVPEESIRYHGERNHFSNWLKARTEFWLAHKLRPRKVTDFSSIEEIRKDLINSLQEYRRFRQRGLITDFKKESFDPNSSFARIGGGSLGGKARGLSFVNILINNYNVQNYFKNVKIYIPPAVVLGTDIFDQFLDENNLRSFALSTSDDRKILDRFLKAKKFPEEIINQLADFLDLVQEPLAVRSSSLLEDSQYHPFAGVYKTYMLPNNNPDPLIRLVELLKAIKRVYASTFYQAAKDYIQATTYRLEEEKMAIIIQKMVGSTFGERFYPHFAGVARSYNFYPIPPQKSSDGVASVALGLGKMVVDGGMTIKFCPKYPNRIPQLSTLKMALKNSQNEFYALDVSGKIQDMDEKEDYFVKKYPLTVAEEDGTLHYLGSTYSPENDAIYDGISRSGPRIVSFAPILKGKLFPLAEILEMLLELGSWGMGTPVEIEFAVNLSRLKENGVEFGLLQIRPLVLNREIEELKIEDYAPERLICQSEQVLGNGIIKDIYDIVYVDRERFDRSQSRLVAQEVSMLNSKLLAEKRPYLLIGVGRWGTLDPWLGIPVTWDQICGARAIVEADFKDMSVAPSQGSHFFQNLNSFMVGYFTVHSNHNHSFIDWEWLSRQPAVDEAKFTRHLRFSEPITVKMNGHVNKGVILKPGENDS